MLRLLGFVGRRRDAGVRQMFADQFDVVFRTDIAVVRMVDEKFDPIQYHAEARAVRRFDSGAEMMEQRLYFTPMDIPAGGILKQGA